MRNPPLTGEIIQQLKHPNRYFYFGPHLIKKGLTSIVEIIRSYDRFIHSGISYTGETTPYWIRALDSNFVFVILADALVLGLHCSGRSQNIIVTSKWAHWRLKSPAFRLFAQPSVQAQIKENIKTPRRRETTCHRWLPSKRANNAENVCIWWRHHF